MFSVVVRLEEGEAQVELEHDAADAPHVARLRPAEFWNHFNDTLFQQLRLNRINNINKLTK